MYYDNAPEQILGMILPRQAFPWVQQVIIGTALFDANAVIMISVEYQQHQYMLYWGISYHYNNNSVWKANIPRYILLWMTSGPKSSCCKKWKFLPDCLICTENDTKKHHSFFPPQLLLCCTYSIYNIYHKLRPIQTSAHHLNFKTLLISPCQM